jgi:hypothetical protein
VDTFALTARNSAESLRAAARTLIFYKWRRFLPWTLGLTVVSAVALFWMARDTEVFWLNWVAVIYLVISLLQLPIAYWLAQRRFARRIGGTTQVRMTTQDFTCFSATESHTVPWSSFKFLIRDKYNVHLFLSKSSPIALPVADMSEAEVQFILTHVNQQK